MLMTFPSAKNLIGKQQKIVEIVKTLGPQLSFKANLQKAGHFLSSMQKVGRSNYFVCIYTVRSGCKLRARRTEYKSVFFHTT
jgi:hypothetical protein